jgi:ribosome modulation factor
MCRVINVNSRSGWLAGKFRVRYVERQHPGYQRGLAGRLGECHRSGFRRSGNAGLHVG